MFFHCQDTVTNCYTKTFNKQGIFCQFLVREDVIAEGNTDMCLQLSMLQRTEQHRVQ